MADFCKQCSEEDFGEYAGDLRNISHVESLEEDEGIPAICEGCGYTYVDLEGQCVGWGCLRNHPKPDNKVLTRSA